MFIFGSNGIWILLLRRIDKRDDRTKLLLGLCHDRIYHLSLRYIHRGWVTIDELTNLQKYLTEPYFRIGGNGVVKRIVDDVFKLDIRDVKSDGDLYD